MARFMLAIDDDNDDPFLTKVKYRVAKSTDGGKATFPTQKAVSDVAFNPCIGLPGVRFLWRLHADRRRK